MVRQEPVPVLGRADRPPPRSTGHPAFPFGIRRVRSLRIGKTFSPCGIVSLPQQTPVHLADLPADMDDVSLVLRHDRRPGSRAGGSATLSPARSPGNLPRLRYRSTSSGHVFARRVERTRLNEPLRCRRCFLHCRQSRRP